MCMKTKNIEKKDTTSNLSRNNWKDTKLTVIFLSELELKNKLVLTKPNCHYKTKFQGELY